MFDTVLGRDTTISRWGSGATISVAVHAVALALILWLGARAVVPTVREMKIDFPIVTIGGHQKGVAQSGPTQARKAGGNPPATRKVAHRKIAPLTPPSDAPPAAPSVSEPGNSASEDLHGSGPYGSPVGDPNSAISGIEPSSFESKTVRQVPSFVFDKQLIVAPDPHLPPAFLQQHPHQILRGEYRLCAGTDGRIISMTALTPIPGADEAIIQQVRKTWRYKEQPVPVCSRRTFVFRIN